MLRVSVVILAGLILTGCQSLNQLLSPTIAEETMRSNGDKTSGLGTLAVTQDRRLILSNLQSGEFCAEPPAEAAEAITSAIAAALQENQQSASQTQTVNLSESIQYLYQRAHTLQLFRDAAFYLCVNAINQSDDNNTSSTAYGEALKELVQALKEPLREEIRYYYQAEIARARNSGGSSGGEVIVCAPATGAEGTAASIQCQRMGPLLDKNPSVIEPPLTPDPAAATRPVM